MNRAPRPPMAPPPDAAAGERTPRRGRRRWWPGALAFGFLGAVLGLGLFVALQDPPTPLTREDVEAAVASAMKAAAEDEVEPAEVFEAIFPSLVYIRTTGSEESPEGRGVGAGVIINADGSILTAFHVVEGVRTISVTFADRTEATAQIRAALPDKDLAVLLPSALPEVVVPAVLSGTGGMRIGDPAFAVGNPLGFAASFTSGVISGFDRTLPFQRAGRTLTGLIQFDAAVNPGSSGGPLLDGEGRVVGIVTALANPTNREAFSGIGFAVPLSAAGGAGGPPR